MKAQDAENRLELKEESEKAKLFPVKEKPQFKRFDLVSSLAVLGVLLVLLFESAFIFEFYRADYGRIEPYLPGIVKEWLMSAPPEEAGFANEELELADERLEPADAELVPVQEVPEPNEEESVPAGAEPVPAEESAPALEPQPIPVG